MSTLDHIRGMECNCCGRHTNLRHLQQVFEGYREHIIRGATEADCPYGYRETGEAAWKHGALLAQADKENPGK